MALCLRYKKASKIGAGYFASVFLAVDEEDMHKKVAIKVIDKASFARFQTWSGTDLSVSSEATIMRRIQHMNIMQLLDSFEDAMELHLVLNYCEGGNLMEHILQQGPFVEYLGGRVFVQLIAAMQYLHGMTVVHRDLKPENILLSTGVREVLVVQIADFGLAVQFNTERHCCRTFCGTPHYAAPEIILTRTFAESTYGLEVDMWAMGVVLYIILSATPPFDAENGSLEMYECICGGKWEFDADEFSVVTPAGLDMVRRLLEVNSRQRLSARQTSHHSWYILHCTETVQSAQ